MTCAVKGKLPACVGVPEIAPDAAFNCRPGGSEPDAIDQLRAPVLPPTDVNVVLYGTVTSPGGKAVDVDVMSKFSGGVKIPFRTSTVFTACETATGEILGNTSLSTSATLRFVRIVIWPDSPGARLIVGV